MGWLLVLILVGCTHIPIAKLTDAKTTAEPPAFALPGESFEYRVTLRGIVVGRVRVAIGEAGVVAGTPAVISRARGDTAGVAAMLLGKGVYESRTTLDLEHHRPLEHHEEMWIEVPGMKKHHERSEGWEDGEAQDAHSAIALLRGWRSQPGEKIELRVRLLAAQLDIEASHTRREYLPAAHAHAVRYDGTIEAEHGFVGWISDDPSRVPLRFELGSEVGVFVVELVTYQAPPDRGP